MNDTEEQSGSAMIYDVATLLMVLVGGFVVPLFGWIAAVVMAWNLPRWSAAQKWLATLVWPVALAAPVAAVVFNGVLAPEQSAIAVIGAIAFSVLVVPAATIHLGLAAARGRRRTYSPVA